MGRGRRRTLSRANLRPVLGCLPGSRACGSRRDYLSRTKATDARSIGHLQNGAEGSFFAQRPLLRFSPTYPVGTKPLPPSLHRYPFPPHTCTMRSQPILGSDAIEAGIVQRWPPGATSHLNSRSHLPPDATCAVCEPPENRGAPGHAVRSRAQEEDGRVFGATMRYTARSSTRPF